MAKKKEEIISWLEQQQPEKNTGWRERAEWRRANRTWLHRSQEIAVRMLDKMEQMHLTQKSLAERMGCSQQYVSKVLKGQENLSLETITKIENTLDIDILVRSRESISYDTESQKQPISMIADDTEIDYKA